ncbi:TRAP transporter small permease [Enterococcus columbae]|uniref:TRAP dicarboxylate transporter subunit DctQ n=1 Tax=Enterococcus columbae DSM 7374 = ATCC 51263 TaxID=1121865 RepID=S0KYI9_9ENTE|nr:TRAP transporter small permease [Enterococcus columbae]EOT44331.1 TRAP dicarboxylate transporter subunit DctQ [Enterococcus columbae DSM 7374 = ATCC 51263]EOW84489.1 TRAP dicarboxylate transporter subunit DctQ [Enterococcus columbae DSM 7374 = ATCC 51263]
MKSLRNFLDRVLELLCSSVLVIMIFVVLYQVFTRTVLNKPNTISEELVRFSLVWLAMLSSAYVTGKKSHLAVTLLSEHLSEKNQYLLEVIVQILFMIFSVVIMVFGGLKAVSVTLGQISPSLSLSMGFVYLAVPVSGALMFAYSLLNLFDFYKLNKGDGK